MKYFEPKGYRANREFIKKVKGYKLFTFFVSKINNLEPFRADKRPWRHIHKKNEDGFDLYVTTAVIDFILPDGRICRIPKGFEWDGASIPKWAQWIIGKPIGRYSLGALLHDWLYASRILGDDKKGRLEADELFLLALTQLKIAWWRRKAMYRAVRLGGSYAYHETSEVEQCKLLFIPFAKYNPWRDYSKFYPKAK